MGVVISSKAKIGNHITIYHNTTIGVNENKPENEKKVVINDYCYVSVGCKIINCTIGENCTLAPNTVVYKDLSPNSFSYSVNKIRLKTDYEKKNNDNDSGFN